MKTRKIFVVAIAAIGISISQYGLVYAASTYTISYADMGVDNIQIPEEYAVITRSDSYNTSSLEDDYGVDLSTIRSNLNNSNTYVCAISYDSNHEIDIDFSEIDYAFNIADLRDYSSDEIMDLMGLNDFSGADNLQVSYVDVGDNATILISGYIPSLDQYAVQYTCTSIAEGKNYLVLFKLYSYGDEPSASMKNDLKEIVKNSSISSPKSSLSSGKIAADFYELLMKAGEGAVAGGIVGGVAYLVGRKNRKKNEKKMFCARCGNVLTSDNKYCEKCGTKVVIDK